ncbi:hypothetical protein [Natrarchaeobaculum aegyptiacum]|uniref:Uncharacterized protein n=1 Tax=Natrarchaeobaculum aegyptiacum TaxID=745377 RepID=A0A2Z2I005_9EURY|nr:hypothetical protein [Natrarchaeobaculum aegyptiacum]ARS90764.1 hypothetical protein B1756_14210 [Natrarchaeobaculum aegyptiacum]
MTDDSAHDDETTAPDATPPTDSGETGPERADEVETTQDDHGATTGSPADEPGDGVESTTDEPEDTAETPTNESENATAADSSDVLTRFVDDTVDRLGETDVQRGIGEFASVFAAAGFGLAILVLVSLVRLVGVDYTTMVGMVEGLLTLQEVTIVLSGVAIAGLVNYVLLAGLVGVESTVRFPNRGRAITVAALGSAVGVVVMIGVLVVATTVGVAAVGLVAPASDEVGAGELPGDGDDPFGDEQSAGDNPFAEDQSTGEDQTDSTEDGADDGLDLPILEVIGAIFGAVIYAVVAAVLAGLAAGASAYLTTRYGTTAV